MVGYKTKYFQVLGELERLRSNCIDLRDHYDSSKPIIFSRENWLIDESNENYILIERKKDVNL